MSTRDHFSWMDPRWVNSDTDLVKPLDLPEFERTGDSVVDKEDAERRLQLQQAYSRGKISAEEAISAYTEKDTGIFGRSLEAVTGIEATESGVDTFINILSLGLYASAAFQKSRHEAIKAVGASREDGEVPFWHPVRYLPVFSPSTFAKNYREKTTFADVFGEEYGLSAGGIGSFVLDVALDPVTYLTLGTGTGAKVLLKSTSPVMAKAVGPELAEKAAAEGAQLTISRWGTQMHREAVQDLIPKIEKEIAEEVAEGATISATRQRQLLNERAAEYMIENYSTLARRAWDADKRLVTRGRRIIGEIAEEGAIPTMEQMFVETTPLHLRELGIGGAALRRQLESIPQGNWFGDAFYGTMKFYNKTWGVDDNTRMLLGVMQNTIKLERTQWTRRIAEDFKGLTDEEAKTVTQILESGIDKSARNSADVLEHDYAPHLLEAAEKARAIFDDIAVEEQKYNVLNNVIEDYVTHMFNGDEAKKAMFQQIVKDKGLHAGGNQYSRHRQVATLTDFKALFPDDVVEENIYNILMRRKLQSIDIVNREKFYLELKATHGMPAVLLAKAGTSVPAAVRKRMIESRDTAAEISDIRQWYAYDGIDSAKFGFKEGDSDQNLRVLEWLTTGVQGRSTEAAWMTDYLRNYSSTVKKDFSTRLANESAKVDAVKAIRGALTGDPFDQVPIKRMAQALKKFDKELRSADIGPLLGLMPELESAIKAGLKNPNKPPKAYNDLIKELRKPVEGLKKSAQIPEDLVTRAIQYTQKMGIYTDVTKPGKFVMDDIKMMLGGIGKGKRGFGFKPEETEQLIDVMFNKKNLEQLNAAEADRLQNFLSLYHGDAAARARYMKLTGEPLVKVDFISPMGVRPSTVKTNIDDVLKSLEPELSAAAGKVSEIGKQISKYNRQINSLKSDKKRMAAIKRGMRSLVDDRKALKRNTPEWTESMNKSRELKDSLDTLQSKSGRFSDIDKKIKRIEKQKDKSVASQKKARSERLSAQSRKNLAEKHSKYLRYPTDKNRIAYEKALSKAGVESTVKVLPKSPRVFKPGKFAEDLARAGEETIGPNFAVNREMGTFGPQIQEAGERILTEDAVAYYLPKSIADVVKDINTSIYGHELGSIFRKYDAVQNMLKAPLMAVFPEFYMRNSVTNVALTYLKSGVAMLNPKHQATFLKVLTYVLSKETIDITNLPKSQAAFMAYAGGAAGGIIGGMQEAQESGTSVLNPLNYLSGKTLAGALGGAGAGAAIGGAAGVAMRGALQNVAKGGVAAQAAVGGTAGALAADDNRIEGFIAGAAIGGGAARYALGDGYRNVEKLAKHTVKIGRHKMTIEELAHEAARRGVFTTHVSEEIFKQGGAKVLAMGERVGLKADEGWKEALKPANALFARDSFRAGELASEIPSRLMLFTIEAERTGSLGMAERAVKDYLFDYANLGIHERRIIKRMMPFYTWTKHALITSIDSIIQNPGRVSQQFRFINNQNLSQDVDPSDYPDWLSTRLKRIKTVYNPESGEKEIEVQTGYGLVQEDTMQLWKELFGGKPYKVFGRGPFGVTPVFEGMLDKDFFRGTHIESQLKSKSAFESGREFKDAPPWMKQAVGYTVDPDTGFSKVDPRASWLLSEVPYSRFLNIAKKVYDSEDQSLNYVSLARQVLGEKVYKYGPEQKLYYDKARLDRMAFFLKGIGEVRVMEKVVPTTKKRKSLEFTGGR